MKQPILKVVAAQASVGWQPIHRPVDLTIAPGETVLLRGSNGAGKTSLLWAILGLRRLRTGNSQLNGREVIFGSTYRFTSNNSLALATQFPSAPLSLTVAEYLYTHFSKNEALEFVAVFNELLCSLGLQLAMSSILGTLSVGQRKAFELLYALRRRPTLLAADEPFSGLAPALQIQFIEKMREYVSFGGAMLVIAHAPEQQQIHFDKAVDITQL